jgi:hypothetical protein
LCGLVSRKWFSFMLSSFPFRWEPYTVSSYKKYCRSISRSRYELGTDVIHVLWVYISKYNLDINQCFRCPSLHTGEASCLNQRLYEKNVILYLCLSKTIKCDPIYNLHNISPRTLTSLKSGSIPLHFIIAPGTLTYQPLKLSEASLYEAFYLSCVSSLSPAFPI